MLRKLFSRKSAGNTDMAPEIAARESYREFEVQATPIKEGSVWRVAGNIVDPRTEASEPQTFIRVDTCTDREDAVALSLRKACQIVDEQSNRQRNS